MQTYTAEHVSLQDRKNRHQELPAVQQHPRGRTVSQNSKSLHIWIPGVRQWMKRARKGNGRQALHTQKYDGGRKRNENTGKLHIENRSIQKHAHLVQNLKILKITWSMMDSPAEVPRTPLLERVHNRLQLRKYKIYADNYIYSNRSQKGGFLNSRCPLPDPGQERALGVPPRGKQGST